VISIVSGIARKQYRGFALILGVFHAFLVFYNRNGFSGGGFEPGKPA